MADTGKIWAALVAARRKMRQVGKGGQNPHHRYNYARLEDYHEAIGDTLLELGVMLQDSVATAKVDGGRAVVELITKAVHEDGSCAQVTSYGEGIDKGDKAIYKAITGARKYGVAMLLGLVTTDDPEKDSPGAGGAPPQGALKAPASASVPPAPPAKIKALRDKILDHLLVLTCKESIEDSEALPAIKAYLASIGVEQEVSTMGVPALEHLESKLSMAVEAFQFEQGA